MSNLSSRPCPRSRRRLSPTKAQPMTENMEVDGNDNHDRKLRSKVQPNVTTKKVSENDLEKQKCSRSLSPKRSQGQKRISGATEKSIFKGRETPVVVQKLTSTSKNILDELRDLLPRSDLNCKHCEEYILQLIQHIQSIHNLNTNDVDEQFFQSLISIVPEENDQDSIPAPCEIIEIPLTSEGQGQAPTSTSFQNCLKNDAAEFEIDDEEIKSNSEQVGQMEVDPLTSVSVGGRNSDSDPEEMDNNDSDLESLVEENDPDSNSEKNEEKSNQMNIFVCGICEKTFGQKIDVQKHMSIVHTNTNATVKTFTCEICNENYEGEELLTEHKRIHAEEPEEKHYTCKTCGKIYANPEKLHVHLKRHIGERPFKCTKCGKCFWKKKNLTDHEYYHGEKSFVCKFPNCEKSFIRKTHLQNHMDRIHTGEKKLIPRIHTGEKNLKPRIHTALTAEENRIRGIHTGGKRYKCETENCGKSYWAPSKLVEHMRTHTGERPFKCTVCDATFYSSGICARHIKLHERKPKHACEHCGKEFQRKGDLQKHSRIHAKEKRKRKPKEKKNTEPDQVFNCEICHKICTDRRALRNHKIRHNEKSQMCEHCGKYYQPREVRRHILRVHSEQMPPRLKLHKCDTCEKSYESPAQLIVHKRTHTGEKPFMCEFCSMCFVGTRALKDHVRIHQGKSFVCEHCGKGFHRRIQLRVHVHKNHTQENPYKCVECEESFLLPRQLELHQRIHTGKEVYKCEECGKYFPVLNQFTVHQACHTKEKRLFPCSKCNKTFRLKTHLTTHFKIHTGDKPHKCEDCGKCFTFLSKLTDHQKRKTNCSQP